jgi:hypothetical protein
MINNIHDQLVGRAGKMQVAGADMGLAPRSRRPRLGVGGRGPLPALSGV